MDSRRNAHASVQACARVHTLTHNILPLRTDCLSLFYQNKLTFVLTHSFHRESTYKPSYLKSNILYLQAVQVTLKHPQADILEVNSGRAAVGGLHFYGCNCRLSRFSCHCDLFSFVAAPDRRISQLLSYLIKCISFQLSAEFPGNVANVQSLNNSYQIAEACYGMIPTTGSFKLANEHMSQPSRLTNLLKLEVSVS